MLREKLYYFLCYYFSYLILFSHPHHNHPAVVKQQYDTQSVWDFENHWHNKLFSCKPMGRCKNQRFYKRNYFI